MLSSLKIVQKRNYNKFLDCSPFVATILLQEQLSHCKMKRGGYGAYYYKKQATANTSPNLEYLFANGIGIESHCVDKFFRLFSTDQTKHTYPKALTV